MTIRTGCAVWAHKHWVGSLYPSGTPATAFLQRYSERVATVEGNATFYAIPSTTTVAKWAAETPSSFRFCCKIPKLISHAATLADTFDLRDQFLERMHPLGIRQGPYFLQLPPRFGLRHFGLGHAPFRLHPGMIGGGAGKGEFGGAAFFACTTILIPNVVGDHLPSLRGFDQCFNERFHLRRQGGAGRHGVARGL